MILSKPSILSHWLSDSRLALLLSAVAAASALLLLLIPGFLLKESWPLVNDGHWHLFFADTGWYPLEGNFGLLPMLAASLLIMAGAVLLAMPTGLACAIFLTDYASGYVHTAFHLLLAVLTGMPSVVLGLWGLMVLVPLINAWQPPGASLLAAMLVLALMILPMVALGSAAALRAVPASMMHGALALGMRRMTCLTRVALPAARHGILAALLLATARALGETMVVLMVAGNVVAYPHSLFDPVRALTANIALEMGYAMGMHRAGLFASGLILTLIVLLLAGLATLEERRTAHG